METNLRQRHLHWEGDKLFYRKKLLTELIPHDSVPNHYHLKFFWRNEKTPEFFNKTNARENARLYSIHNVSLELQAAPLVRLNEEGVPIQPTTPKNAVRGCNG